MTDGEALLAAILANPDEDTPRLAYADWLEERGLSLWAAFIRRSIKRSGPDDTLPRLCLWRNADKPGKPESFYWGVASSSRDWPKGTIREMAPCLPPLETWNTINELYFERGLIIWLVCAWEYWKSHSPAILAAHPVRKVTLTTYPSFEQIENGGRLDGDEWSYWGSDGVEKPGSYTDVAKWLCNNRWPGIRFELPPINWRPGRVPYRADDPTPTHEPPLGVE